MWKGRGMQDQQTLDKEEEDWIHQFSLPIQGIGTLMCNPNIKISWNIWMDEKDLLDWRLKQKYYIILFDGASKGKSQRASVGGIILNPKWRMEFPFLGD